MLPKARLICSGLNSALRTAPASGQLSDAEQHFRAGVRNFRMADDSGVIHGGSTGKRPAQSALRATPYTSSKLRSEPAAGKKFSGGALAASDGTVHRPIVPAAIRRFSREEQGIPNRCS